MIFLSKYLFVICIINLQLPRTTKPKLLSFCMRKPKTDGSSSCEEQPQNLPDVPSSSTTGKLETAQQTLIKAKAPVLGSVSEPTDQPQTSKQDITSINPIPIRVVSTNLIIDDVKEEFENFQGNADIKNFQGNAEISVNFSSRERIETVTLIHMFMEEHMLKESSSDWCNENFFKGIYVIYIAAEYFHSLILCKVWNEIKAKDESKFRIVQELGLEGVSEKCSYSLSILHTFIKASKNALDNKISFPFQKEEFDFQKEEFDSMSSSFRDEGRPQFLKVNLIKVESVKYEYNPDGITFSDIVTTLLDFLKVMDQIYINIEIKIEEFLRINEEDHNNLLSNMYKWINEKLSKYRKLLRTYFTHLNIEKSFVDFYANTQVIYESTNNVDKEPSISPDEEFIWRNVVKVYQVNPNMHPLEFLSRCEEHRNELIYYSKGQINQILPVHIPRIYKYPNFYIETKNKKFFKIILSLPKLKKVGEF